MAFLDLENASPGGLPQVALTKTVPPAVGRARIERKRLLALLKRAAGYRLILVRAPAGYGKTTLAVDWCEQLRRGPSIVAWLSVDEGDNEPSAFAYHISRTLHRAAPAIGQSAIDLLSETKLIPSRNVLSAAINSIAESDSEVYLFLDDYHAITDGRSHELAGFLLRYAPSNFHLVITTRTEPPLSIAKLRLSDEVVEFDAGSLRFSPEETAQFFGADLSPRLDPADVSKLHEATEGWPAALQLARITLRNSADPSKTVNSLTGASRKISAYIEDTLATQADDIVQFLLETSILDRLDGSLCRAVTGIARSAELLKALRHEQLLLVTLDEQNGWYRYHHLMSDFLIDRLLARMPDKVPELHRRASRWYALHQMWNEAVQHALAAEDFDLALGYVEQCAMPLVIKGDLLTLLAWERQLPPKLMAGQPQVKLALAWGLALVSRLAEADVLLSQVEELARTKRLDELWWHARVCRAAWQALSDDSVQAIEVGKECQQYTSHDAFDANSICNAMRFGYWKSGDWDAFYALPKPDPGGDEATYILAENYRLCLYGMAAAHRLQIDDALALYAQARALAEKYVGAKSVSAAMVTGHSAHLRYERGDVSAAEISVLDELDIIETTIYHESFLSAYTVLIGAALLRDDAQRAFSLLDRAERLSSNRGWPRPLAMFLLMRVRLLLREKRSAEAEATAGRLGQLAGEHPAPQRCSWSDIHTASEVADGLTATALGRGEEGVRLLAKAYARLLSIDNRFSALRVGLDLATALFAGGHRSAFDVLCEVIGWAAEAGARAFILERHSNLLPLLSAAQKEASFGENQLIVQFLSQLTREGPEGASRNELTERDIRQLLTDRERSIIEFIANGQSNKKIARTLGVTPETVKTHLKRIFVKLSAETRAQAVVRAQSLGLFQAAQVS
jgi:LuxR family maltose regulon positive regulatory protein